MQLSFLTKETFFQILRFGIVGVIATLLHYAIYWSLKLYINYNVAYSIGYFLSFIANFFLTSYFTFRKKATVHKGFGFGGAHLFNCIIQLLLLNVFVFLGINKDLAPIPTYAISIPINFLMVRYIFIYFKK